MAQIPLDLQGYNGFSTFTTYVLIHHSVGPTMMEAKALPFLRRPFVCL